MSNCIIPVAFSIPSDVYKQSPKQTILILLTPCVSPLPSPKVEEGERKREKNIIVLPLTEVLSLWVGTSEFGGRICNSTNFEYLHVSEYRKEDHYVDKEGKNLM